MFRVLTLLSKFHSHLWPLIVYSLWATSAQAACTALPLLSVLVNEVGHLETQTDEDAIRRSGKKIAARRAGLEKARMYTRLSAVGFERHLKSIMELKIKLGALSQIALTGNKAKLAAYQKSSDFQRRFGVAEELVAELCASRGALKQTDAATKEYQTSGGYRLTQLSGLGGVAAAFGLLSLCAALLVALIVGAGLHRRRTKREKRRNKRVPCNVPVLVTAEGQTSMQRLVDVSRTGANMENDLDLPIGAKLILSFSSLRKESEITWSNDHFSGVLFDRSLSQNEMDAALQDSCSLSEAKNRKRDTISGVAQIT